MIVQSFIRALFLYLSCSLFTTRGQDDTFWDCSPQLMDWLRSVITSACKWPVLPAILPLLQALPAGAFLERRVLDLPPLPHVYKGRMVLLGGQSVMVLLHSVLYCLFRACNSELLYCTRDPVCSLEPQSGCHTTLCPAPCGHCRCGPRSVPHHGAGRQLGDRSRP